MHKLYLVSIVFIYTQCTYSQNNTNKQTMSTVQKNTIYSKTNKEKVNIDNEEWKKILPSEVYEIARK